MTGEGREGSRVDEDWLAQRLIGTPRWHLPVERRVCAGHPENVARDRCDRCGRPFCEACLRYVRRWRVCRDCLALLGRERVLQQPPARLRRGWPELVAAVVILLVVVGTAGLIQHLLGSAASDAAFARVALGLGGGAHAATPAATGRPTLQIGGAALGWESNAAQARFNVSGSGFRPNEQVKLTATWTATALDGATVSRMLGPLPEVADAKGLLTAYLDLGSDLPPPAAGGVSLKLTAIGNQGSTATLATILRQPPTPTPRPRR